VGTNNTESSNSSSLHTTIEEDKLDFEEVFLDCWEMDSSTNH
jgi:hypothetical protein